MASDRDHEFDLLIRSGRAVCPANGWDRPGAVAVRGGRCVAAGLDVHGTAAETIDLPDSVLLPGLIDLHAHPAKSGSIFGVDPDVHMLRSGVTTVLSQGDAGAGNWRSYVSETIGPSKTRVLLAMNLSRVGESTPAGCFANLDDADVSACVAAVEGCREHVWGIAVNASHHACGRTDPREVVRRGVEAAQQTGLPLLYGMRRPEDWSFDEQLQQLRPGDVVTYCYRRRPHCIVERGRVHPAIRAARERGILFDVGHGMASFDFEVAAAAIADGFPPDTISTDLQRTHVSLAPPHDLPRTMSKLRAAGMAEADVFRAVTARPAAILRRESEIGCLTSGACADFTVLKWHATPTSLFDCHDTVRLGGYWTPLLTVRGGELVRAPSPAL
jgi:dihydroorotase